MSYNKQKRKWLFIPTIALLLSSCYPNASLPIIQKQAAWHYINRTPSKKELFTKAQTAPDPQVCSNTDQCYFDYINQRSMSLKITSMVNKKTQSSFGTGWIIDREVGNNNFYIVTNIHVCNLTTDDLIKNHQDPELFSIEIGRQKYDAKTNWTKSNKPIVYNPVGIDQTNYYAEQNRYAIRVDSLKTTVLNPNQHQYYFNFSMPPGTTQAFLQPKTQKMNKVFFDSFVNNEFIKAAQRLETKYQWQNQSLFLPTSFYQYFSHLYTSKTNGIGLYDSNQFNELNKIDYDQLTTAQKQFLDGFYHDDKVESFIDAAVLKVRIPDQVLAEWFPYFLDTKKYNQWTFPRLAQTNLYDFNADQKNLTTFDLNSEQRKQKFYRAGYPLETFNKNSSAVPVFRGSASTGIKIQRAYTNQNLDHFKYNRNKMRFGGADYKVPIGLYNIYSQDTYPTAAGSSGSMVIDQDYNTVGIYWGESSGDGVSKTTERLGIQTPFYSDQNNVNSQNHISHWANHLPAQQKNLLYQIMGQHYGTLFAKNLSAVVWAKYQQQTDLTQNGFRFGADPAQLYADINQFMNQQPTQHAQTHTDWSDEQKQAAITTALTQHLTTSLIPESNGTNSKTIAELYGEFFGDYYNHTLDLLNDLSLTFKGTTVGDTINLKQQLQDYFATKNVVTYNLNHIKKSMLRPIRVLPLVPNNEDIL
ncbi:hypothetical protein J2Z62_000721 [Mycoplasmoides fastidiosum]|uniref:DUF31 domain-containing protein n=1 Tax=Mycoplasmoides fastidiosum TaxID=92758 RepID=A0ABU0LZZ7_9BACT|nr:DUF31 family protein [Mycoplasmoides fastidiosum]MDQ0514283.1 hypothetical protein [Mycoplasmoides fastidiosum]UUD38110.1 DUF31 family protein [Mycoplasmoides fastidiosum]